MRPKGFLSVKNVTLADGKVISNQQAVDYGWFRPGTVLPGWDLAKEEIPLGPNLWSDNGRQLLAYCFGFKSPVSDFVCANFGVGTGTTAPTVVDVALES